MNRITRYWFCKKCKRHISRRKSEKSCFCCGQPMKATTTYNCRAAEQRRRILGKKMESIQRAKARHSRNRTIFGVLLKLRPETRAAYMLLAVTVRRDAWVKRAQSLIELIADDARTCRKHGICKSGPTECRCPWPKDSHGVQLGYPKVKLSTFRGARLGCYTYGLLNPEGWSVQVSHPEGATRAEWLATLIHEAVHMIDHLTGVPCNVLGSHGPTFEARMAELTRLLRGRARS